MRVPATTAALCAGLLALGSRSGEGSAGAPAPIVILERGDDGARADGLVARRWAVLSDGTLLAAERDGSFGTARLEPDVLAALVARIESARLSDLPPVVASRADWFDARDVWCTLSAAREGGVCVRIEGDLRPGSPDRALAPHGFVEVLEVLDAARPAPRAVTGGIGRVEFHLVPWSARAASPHAPVEDPLPWPHQAGAWRPRANWPRNSSGWHVRDARSVTVLVSGGSWHARGSPARATAARPEAGGGRCRAAEPARGVPRAVRSGRNPARGPERCTRAGTARPGTNVAIEGRARPAGGRWGG